MAGQNVLTLTDSTFDADVVKSEVPVLVDFWAAWCGPCRAIAPAVDEIATEYAGRLSVGKVDVDSNGGVAMRYRITSIPTLLLFKEGRVADTVVGPRGKPDIVKMIERHVQ
jgi:thioredoxin 1